LPREYRNVLMLFLFVFAISSPVFYDIRPSNKCNLMCRGCEPKYSHLIEKESKTHNIVYDYIPTARNIYSDLKNINIDNLDQTSRVYLTGGDPTVIPEIHNFIEQSIQDKWS
jgi:organic radical activating enzyme